jgi:hypothetical protein
MRMLPLCNVYFCFLLTSLEGLKSQTGYQGIDAVIGFIKVGVVGSESRKVATRPRWKVVPATIKDWNWYMHLILVAAGAVELYIPR